MAEGGLGLLLTLHEPVLRGWRRGLYCLLPSPDDLPLYSPRHRAVGAVVLLNRLAEIGFALGVDLRCTRGAGEEVYRRPGVELHVVDDGHAVRGVHVQRFAPTSTSKVFTSWVGAYPQSKPQVGLNKKKTAQRRPVPEK
jgi:hypothetical protein